MRENARTVYAPEPTGAAQNSVLSVVLNPLEQVEWIWTHLPNGSYVSGYTLKRADHGSKHHLHKRPARRV